MAKTFDNISEASATNYLFLFAQRTLALQDELPTPPPLNALGLPCQAICRLWAWRKKSAVKEKLAGESEQAGEAREVVETPEVPGAPEAAAAAATAAVAAMATAAAAAAAEGEEAFGRMEVPSSDNALKGTVAKATADKPRLWLGSVNSDEATQTKTAPVEETVAIEAISGEEATAVKAVAVDGQDATAAEALPSSPPPSPSPEEVVTPGEKTPLVKEKTLAEKIAPLAEKIAEYILDHQDDAAQEDRWRTIMKRDMTKSFHKVEKEMQAQREEVQGQREEMQRQFDDVLSKLNQLVRWQTSSSSV